jgi:hypothetical protein
MASAWIATATLDAVAAGHEDVTLGASLYPQVREGKAAA